MSLTPSFLEQEAFNVAVDVICHIDTQLSRIGRRLTICQENQIRSKSQKIFRENPKIENFKAFLELSVYSRNLVNQGL